MAERSMVDEFSSVNLGDARLGARLRKIVAAVEARPDAGFPQAMGSDADTEGLYRFLGNEKVSWDALLGGHARETYERAKDHDTILAVHDSSLFQFQGEGLRDGMFRTSSDTSGFLGHACLAISADGLRRPLGLLGMIPVVRPSAGAPEDGVGAIYANESDRWQDLVAIVEDEAPRGASLIHVMDREGDAYALLDLMNLLEADFVVRLAHDRRVSTPEGTKRLSELLPSATTRLTRKVQLTRRSNEKAPPALKKSHPSREEREAELEIRVLTTKLLRPQQCEANSDTLDVNVVHVVEVDAPPGQEPVSWLLLTSLPIDRQVDVAAVVDAYRARWLIEEYFKALKTGCAFEKRQLESLDTVLVAFSILAPIAWRLLAMRWLTRSAPGRPATDVFTKRQIRLLRHIEKTGRHPLPAAPTVRQAMFAIARLGGFLKSNKEPGWQILGRGLIRFNDMYGGFESALAAIEAGVLAEDSEM